MGVNDAQEKYPDYDDDDEQPYDDDQDPHYDDYDGDDAPEDFTTYLAAYMEDRQIPEDHHDYKNIDKVAEDWTEYFQACAYTAFLDRGDDLTDPDKDDKM